jgi:signal transduction histidine kinase
MLNESQKMASVGGWEFDVDSGKLYWTEEVYRIHDKEIGAEIMVDEGLSYFEGESKALVEKALQKTIETGESYDLQLRFTSAKGVKKWVRAIGYASLVDGKVKKLRGTFQDITKQVEAEQKIIEQNKRLEKNDEEKEKLYSIIAHDLRGGFNGIIGLLEVLKEDFESLDLEEEYWYKLKLAINSARNANQLMENLLKWIKAQNTFMPSNNKLVNISSLIVDCESFVKPSLIKKNIEIVNEVGDIEVHGDQDMLGTVFRNLISNAVKFSRTESQIVIKGKKIDSNTAEFRIKDFGIGMSADVIENLFNKSYRPKRLGTSKEKGTGLGLILCNELIELHGGTIKVQSEEGSGSEFIVLLPLNEAEV